MAVTPTTSRSSSRNGRALICIALFVLFAGGSLVLVVNLASALYPRRLTPMEIALGNSAKQQPQQPWYERLLELDRRMTNGGGGRGGKGKVEHVQPAGGGTVGVPMSAKQLALREISEAQVILANQFSVTDEEAMQAMRGASIQGPFRPFEEDRFVSRMLLMKYLDNQDDQQLLKQLYESTVAVAKQPGAGFEEFNYAGIACLYMGKPKEAEEYLQKALNVWPSRGRGFGNVCLFLMISQAVQGKWKPVIYTLNGFRDIYPDWMYIETYMCDLDDLDAIYPDAPLLKTIKGYCYTLVLNYAAAETCFQSALDSGKLDGQAESLVEKWLVQVKKGKSG